MFDFLRKRRADPDRRRARMQRVRARELKRIRRNAPPAPTGPFYSKIENEGATQDLQSRIDASEAWFKAQREVRTNSQTEVANDAST